MKQRGNIDTQQHEQDFAYHRNPRQFFRKQIERYGINIFTTEGNSQRFAGAN